MTRTTNNTPRWYKAVNISNGQELLQIQEYLPEVERPDRWLFRGTPKGYPLQTSLERVLEDAGVVPKERPERERQLLKEFKRRTHHYLNLLPSDGDVMEWLALMQHYGAPTRLLDWTYSAFIAAYFALSAAESEKGEPCVVWALYREHYALSRQTEKASRAYEKASKRGSLKDDTLRAGADNIYDGVNAFLWSVMSSPEKCVWAINSFRLNERQSVQQGVFMCPGDVRCSFVDNLKKAKPSPKNLVRFELSTTRENRKSMLSVLHRMNISHASLFPGLSGFAQSLAPKLWVSGVLRQKRATHA